VTGQSCPMNRCIRIWVWDQRITPTQKLVLLALAEHASVTFDCWPGGARLMELTGLPVRSVNKALRDLEAKGLMLCLRLMLVKGHRKGCGIRC
jgi:DNA-binding MarR family transcriptional regulator